MLGLNSCGMASHAAYNDMDVNAFSTFIANGDVQLLDVRTADEFADGHIPGAENIDVFDNNFVDIATKALDPSRPVAVYCRSGKRSADAATLLSEKGYDVTNLEGGILAWIRQDKPVEK